MCMAAWQKDDMHAFVLTILWIFPLQVNQWLTWLETAEEEESDGEED